jgi:dethiobiotin synthetase
LKIFITAIGTDSGKTVVSSIFTEALLADYWKPIQAGFPRDSDAARALISNKISKFFPEAYLLKHPESPHSAAKKEGINILLEKIVAPDTEKHLIVEGAGGILVPINENDYVIDIAAKLKAKIVLVSNLYLGSINHTLLSIEELKRRQADVLGIIFNGEANTEAEDLILRKSGYKMLLRIGKEKEITQGIIRRYATALLENLSI